MPCYFLRKHITKQTYLYHSLGYFGRRQIDDILHIFSKQHDLTFHAYCETLQKKKKKKQQQQKNTHTRKKKQNKKKNKKKQKQNQNKMSSAEMVTQRA